MAFLWSDEHVDSFHRHGYAIFRGILPPALVRDLRRVTDQARQIARRIGGPRAQRLQPVWQYDELDQQPFRDYTELPELRDAVERTAGKGVSSWSDKLGVLLEPADMPWCTQWHRDWRDNIAGLELAEFDRAMLDPAMFNQVNCALYEDSATWLVPGSHLRRDLPREAARFPDRPIAEPALEGLGFEERERAIYEYASSMPGGVQTFLCAGDYMLYRPTAWHLGHYLPYRRRATLHDVADTPAFKAWRERVIPACEARRKRGLMWENPNLQVV